MLIEDIIMPDIHLRGRTDLEDMVYSLCIHGQQQPLTLNSEGVLVDGVIRLAAAKMLGWVDIDVKVLTPDEENQMLQNLLYSFQSKLRWS